ncbi:hypothetical protein BDY19DRAFT_158214 [Irpex rosettiformis]|uniref:Uncharacterized protein n=1 Tax=Irpex rosettiformis TaxID=378272 RepID=A0ACB8U3N8_9APHY|nr:hypothetical protein BDY19DRAFT_158214 [Irpex rosettiformis]
MGKSTRKAKVKLHPRRKRRVAPPRGPNVSLFHYLPNELLYIIRDFLPLDDLRSHIAFQSSCRQVRIVYAYDEKFWKAACIAYGIGKPNASKDFPYSISKCTWREIAILVVNHQECCDVPACARFVVPDHLKALWNKVKSPKEVHEQNIQYVGFDASIDFTLEELHGVSGPPRGMEPATLGQEKDLSLHTPGLCKFATSPPMQDIYINGLGFRLLVQNFYGVTVWDVIERIELFRWEHFSPTRLILAYEHHRHQLPCLNVFNWIETLTVGQCMPYIREILREPGNLDSHLSAELRRYRAWITQLHPLLPVRRLIVEAEEYVCQLVYTFVQTWA